VPLTQNGGAMSVRPWSQAPPLAGRQELPQRYQLDYTIHRPELRSVDSPAALNDNFVLRAGDATSASLRNDEMRSVLYTAAT
jgi:hypothetical protein